ncbi:pentatricopeptide repeat-containing protein At5g18950 [Aristolochia californica]|uniref:pentatricopeptide repeat-containing protein At5g18950 n=1 Tax=Aristolochia californica TaxID=171875 RepID=UPI0035DC7D1C
MAKTPPNIISSLAQNVSRLRSATTSTIRTRNLSLDGGRGVGEEQQKPPIKSNESDRYLDISKTVSEIIRTRSGWENSLLSDCPFLDLSDTDGIHAILKHQNNAFLAFRFFRWVSSQEGFYPDPRFVDATLNALVKVRSWKAARAVLCSMKCLPETATLESYITGLCREGQIDEALEVVSELKILTFLPTLSIWNTTLLGSLRIGRTELVWELYEEMMKAGVAGDVVTVGCLIRAFCKENKLSEAYELLHEVLKNGFVPDVVAFSAIISGFCHKRDYNRVSELLHLMIAKNCLPDVFTYQGIIHGLCEKGMTLEGFRVFKDIKERGYAPDVVTYTTMIDGLCKIGQTDEAKKLWEEMGRKRLEPNHYTYNVLIHGYCKSGNLEEARDLFKEMSSKGFRKSTLSYNTMLAGLCLQGLMDEANRVLGEMQLNGVSIDVITYNTLIQGCCKEGKTAEALNFYNELLAKGMQPSTYSYTPLIQALCKEGKLQKAMELFNEMENRELQPLGCTYDYIINRFCEQGNATEGMAWLARVLASKLRPREQTFCRLIECLSLKDRLHDALLVLDAMVGFGYKVRESLYFLLVTRLCKDSFNKVSERLEAVVQMCCDSKLSTKTEHTIVECQQSM